MKTIFLINTLPGSAMGEKYMKFSSIQDKSHISSSISLEVTDNRNEGIKVIALKKSIFYKLHSPSECFCMAEH